MDIKPVRKKPPQPAPATVAQLPKPESLPPAPEPKTLSKKPWLKRSLIVIGGLLLAAIVAVVGWYIWALAPLKPGDDQQIRLVIETGETSSTIADKLAAKKIIKSSLAFRIYTELSGQKHKLQAGGYALSPGQSIQDITNHIVSGRVDEFRVTIVPGLTLKQQLDFEITNSLAQQGFSPAELSAAFDKSYDSPLFATKPAGTTLEGYLYPETYQITAASSAEDLLQLSFSEFYKQIEQAGIEAKLAAHGLTLYQGITLASIVQKEVSNVTDQKQVAQVFLKRLAENMPLQSDPTFIYPARQAGMEPTVNFNSPYNTYLHSGLPPGPIANFNLSALEAVATPAPGDYLFFVADANGVTHFSRTLEEHEAKVEQFCTEHCNDF